MRIALTPLYLGAVLLMAACATQVRTDWKVHTIGELIHCSLSSRRVIRQWAEVIRQLQQGRSCPLLGLHRVTGVGVRLSVSDAVNELMQNLPGLLEDLADIADVADSFSDTLLVLSERINLILRDVACVPLYEELCEFILAIEDVYPFSFEL